RVDELGGWRDRDIPADGGDEPFLDQDDAAVQGRPRARIDSGAADDGGLGLGAFLGLQDQRQHEGEEPYHSYPVPEDPSDPLASGRSGNRNTLGDKGQMPLSIDETPPRAAYL